MIAAPSTMRLDIIPKGPAARFIDGYPGLTKSCIVGAIFFPDSVRSGTIVRVQFLGIVETEISVSSNTGMNSLKSPKQSNVIISLSQDVVVPPQQSALRVKKSVEVPFEFELPDDPSNDNCRWVLPVSCQYAVTGVYKFKVLYHLLAKPIYIPPAITRTNSSSSLSSLSSISSSLSSSPSMDKINHHQEVVPVEMVYYSPSHLLKLIQSYEDMLYRHELSQLIVAVGLNSNVFGRTDPIHIKLSLTPTHGDVSIVHAEVSLKEMHSVKSGARTYSSTRHLISSLFPDLSRDEPRHQEVATKFHVPADSCPNEEVPCAPLPAAHRLPSPTESEDGLAAGINGSSSSSSSHYNFQRDGENHSSSSNGRRGALPRFMSGATPLDEIRVLPALGFSTNLCFEVSHALKFTLMVMVGGKMKCYSWEYPVQVVSIRQSMAYALLETASELLPPLSYEKASGSVLTHHVPIWQIQAKSLTA
ncbi:hypothetical protein SeMB42_g06450 [Synchytrium endobioticum]|uniref:Uncharacterized protein n=1 Tax=Synchytrium endobioticum TaxID=286115 RepID=A0A507CHV9_9FUNG|nr:hypothetical protein SeMB42_g06450 [Synchytrium endobioticum]